MPGSTVLVAMSATFGWAVLMVATRYVLVAFSLNAWALTLVQLLTGGLFMIVLAGRGGGLDAGARRALLLPSTWIYGALRVVSAAAASAALIYVTVTQDTLLATMNVPMAALAIFLVYRRLPRGAEWLAHAAILVGIVLLASFLPGGFGNPAIVLELVAEIAVVISTLVIERHPQNSTESIAARCRFTGIVLMITAVLFLAVWAAMGALGLRVGSAALEFGALDTVFADPVLWLAGGAVGVLLRGPTMYLVLLAIKRTGTQTYLATLALLPFFSLVLEWLMAALGLLPVPGLGVMDYVAGAVILGGTLWLIWLRSRPAA